MRKPNCRTVQRKKRPDPDGSLLPRKHKFVPVSRESNAAFEALSVGTRAEADATGRACASAHNGTPGSSVCPRCGHRWLGLAPGSLCPECKRREAEGR